MSRGAKIYADRAEISLAGVDLIAAEDAAAMRALLGVTTLAEGDLATATAAGTALLTAADAAAQRTALGLGTEAVKTYPLTTANDLYVGGASGAPTRLAPPSSTGTFALQCIDGTLTWVEVV